MSRCVSPASFNERTLVIDGFCKSHGMTGWRLGYVHGPAEIIETMTKLQQYTFVCAPQPVQWAGAVAMDVPMDQVVADYRRKRDLIYGGLADKYEVVEAGRGVLHLPQSPARQRQAVRHQSDRKQRPDHPRQHLQPSRHPLPHLLRGQRRDDRAGVECFVAWQVDTFAGKPRFALIFCGTPRPERC